MRTPDILPSMETVASAMSMTSRTLRRRLLAKEISFVAILDDVRCSLALEYLKTTKHYVSGIIDQTARWGNKLALTGNWSRDAERYAGFRVNVKF